MRPTGPADWLLSFAETRREMRPGLDVQGYHLVRHAVAKADLGDNTGLVQAALRDLVARGVLTQLSYMPHMNTPTLLSATSIWQNNAQTGPMWKWVYRVSADWRERMGLPRSPYWCVEHNGVRYSGEGEPPPFLASSVWLYRFRGLLGKAA
jgi:hypothetical protein